MRDPVDSEIDSIVRSLHVRLGEGFDIAVIEAEVKAALANYSQVPVTQFIPVLVERRVTARLDGSAA